LELSQVFSLWSWLNLVLVHFQLHLEFDLGGSGVFGFILDSSGPILLTFGLGCFGLGCFGLGCFDLGSLVLVALVLVALILVGV